MGRRPKPDEARLHSYSVRLTEADIEELKKKAEESGSSPRELARGFIRHGHVTVRQLAVPTVNLQAVQQLRIIGGLLNQLAKKANLGREVDPLEVKRRCDDLARILTGLV